MGPDCAVDVTTGGGAPGAEVAGGAVVDCGGPGGPGGPGGVGVADV